MHHRDIIAIGGSLGAVEAVRQLCRELPENLAAALFIVIHVGERGNNLLAEIFAEQSPLTVSTARGGEKPRHGHAYVAPAGRHLLLIDGEIRLGHGPRENMARPAIDPLFRSAGACFGPRCIGVVLSGLLNDGASGLADLKRCGGLTVVQNPRGAAAPDMPREALQAADIDYRAPLDDMAALLAGLTRQPAGPAPAIPADIRDEVEIALGTARSMVIPPGLADVRALTCPACGGVLSEIRRRPPLRFRCQVGHAYTAEALAEQTEGAVDEALRVALRIIEERVVLTEMMAQEARRGGRLAAAVSYEARLEGLRDHVRVLRETLESS